MATKSAKPVKKGLSVTGSRDSRRSAKFRESKQKDENKETLAWKVLTDVQTKEIMEVETVEDVQEKVKSMLDLSQHECDLKEATVLDYYVSALWWTREQSFSADQTSAFFTVVHTLIENIKEKQMNIVDNIREMKKMFVGIGMEHCEGNGGLECFETSQATMLTDYLNTSLFQHYKLYEFIFSTIQAEEIIGTDLAVEVAPSCDLPWPPPLEEAIVDHLYVDYIATPPTTPQPTKGAETEDAAAADTTEVEGLLETIEEHCKKETELMAQLTPDQVTTIIQEVFNEMLTGLQTDTAQKLRDTENVFINRINKIHKVAEK